METKTQGGNRKGAGRKPLPKADKKVTIIIYPQKKYVDAWGGIDKLRAKLLSNVEKIKLK